MANKFSQSVMDRAHEWTVENYPDLTEAEFSAKVLEVAQEIDAIDEEDYSGN